MWAWKEGFRFALASTFVTENNTPYIYKKNKIEQYSSTFLKPLYKLIDQISKQIRHPYMIVVVTLATAILTLLVFYNLASVLFLAKLFPLQQIRFVFFLSVQMNLLAAGCKALGRFNNTPLIKAWKSGHLIPVFPGDKKY